MWAAFTSAHPELLLTSRGFKASFISYAFPTEFFIFQTNGQVSVATCQFWFHVSFIIKNISLLFTATGRWLAFNHLQVWADWVCVCGRACLARSHGIVWKKKEKKSGIKIATCYESVSALSTWLLTADTTENNESTTRVLGQKWRYKYLSLCLWEQIKQL